MTYLNKYSVPKGYNTPNQAYGRYSYDDGLWVPGRVGGLSILLPASQAPSPLNLIKSVPVLAWWRGDSVSLNAGAVASMIDKTGHGFDLVQASAGSQPAYTAADATLNNKPTVTGDGASDFLASVGITIGIAFWMCLIVKQIGWTVNHMVCGSAGGSGRNQIGQFTGSPGIALVENGPSPGVLNTAPIGQWKRLSGAENNTTSDFFRAGSGLATGTAVGRVATTSGFTLFAQAGGALFFQGAIAECMITTGIPTVSEQNAIDAYLANSYLPSVLT